MAGSYITLPCHYPAFIGHELCSSSPTRHLIAIRRLHFYFFSNMPCHRNSTGLRHFPGPLRYLGIDAAQFVVSCTRRYHQCHDQSQHIHYCNSVPVLDGRVRHEAVIGCVSQEAFRKLYPVEAQVLLHGVDGYCGMLGVYDVRALRCMSTLWRESCAMLG
jgi:hypothetical protein